MRRKGPFGFTLIELLVVIAVIAIIAALLFPVFAQAREKARQTACLAHMRQVAMALHLYTEDYDETFLWNPGPGGKPASFATAAHTELARMRGSCVDQPNQSFVVLLQPYLKSDGVFRCPSYPGYPLSWFSGYAPSLDPERHKGIGFGVNQLVIGDMCRPRTVASLRNSTSEVALVGEASGPWAGMQNWNEWLKDPSKDVFWGWQRNEIFAEGTGWQPYNGSRHIEGSNFAFADGHAKHMRPVEVTAMRLPPIGSPRAIIHFGHFPKAKLE